MPPLTKQKDTQENSKQNWPWERVIGLFGSMLAIIGAVISLFVGEAQVAWYIFIIATNASMLLYFSAGFNKYSSR